jgi:cysteine desulfurase
MKPVYLDYNATTPIDPRVAGAMMPYIREHFGNPSSSHAYGIAAKHALEEARGKVADLLGCKVEEIVFTSGGTESNNFAIRGVVRAHAGRGKHIITSAIEHPAVIEVCRFLEGMGYKVTYLGVDESGRVDPDDVKKALTPETVLVTVMHANNEVGTIEPIREIAALARRYGIAFHSDCAQSIGKIPVSIDDLGVDLLSIAGHKIYAPKGVGVLYVRQGLGLEKLIHGAGQESGRRAGTENVIEAVALGEACALIGEDLESHSRHMEAMRDRLERGLESELEDIVIHARGAERLPNTASIGFKKVEAGLLLREMAGVAASAGAACHSDQIRVSSVLEAMGVPEEYAMGTIRFSTGRFTTSAEIDAVLDEVKAALA